MYSREFWTQLTNLSLALPESEISFNKYGRKQDFAAALQALSGIKVSETDIRTTIPFKFRQYQREEITLETFLIVSINQVQSQNNN